MANTHNGMPKVALLYGGSSKEREVSRRSAQEVHRALTTLKYLATKVAVDNDLASNLKKIKPDVAFIALHGGSGEDGTLQALLDVLEIPYTGSGVLASALAMHKTMAKRLFIANDISTPAFITVRKGAHEDLAARIKSSIGFPVVIKPPSQGSTIGLSIVHKESDLRAALRLGFELEPELLIEKFTEGVEITVAVLGNEQPKALPTLEIETKTGFYDYETKYTAGLSNHIIPARIDTEQKRQAKKAAVGAYKVLGCRGFARADFICPKGKEPLILEVNTIPGLTKLSLFPDAANAAGIGFNELVNKLIELALE